MMRDARKWKGKRIKKERKGDRSNQINHYLLSITSQVFELKYLFVRFFSLEQNVQQGRQDDGSLTFRLSLSLPLSFLLISFPSWLFNFSFQTTDKNCPRNVFPKTATNKKIESRLARKGALQVGAESELQMVKSKGKKVKMENGEWQELVWKKGVFAFEEKSTSYRMKKKSEGAGLLP